MQIKSYKFNYKVYETELTEEIKIDFEDFRFFLNKINNNDLSNIIDLKISFIKKKIIDVINSKMKGKKAFVPNDEIILEILKAVENDYSCYLETKAKKCD